jgi:putative transposase
MKKKNFSEAQIVSILKTQETGRTVRDICREDGINDSTLYNWKAKYGRIEVSDVLRIKELQNENARLKRIVANLTLEIDVVKTVLKIKYGGLTIKEKR